MKFQYFVILAALPRAERREGVQHAKNDFHMACRDGGCIRSRRGTLYSTPPRQIVAERGRESFGRGVVNFAGSFKISQFSFDEF